MKQFNFRSSIDLTPWDKSGKSAFGMRRENAKKIGTGFIVLSILMMIPPSLPDPTDAINIFISSKLVAIFGITKMTALLLSYTIIPWLIFLIGIYIYPYNTHSLFNGYMNKLKKFVNKTVKNPWKVILGIIIGYYVMQLYAAII